MPITTVALDGRLDIPAALRRVGWPELRRFSYGSVYALEGDARLHVFGFGAVVHDGAAGVDEGIRRALEPALGRGYLPETAETYYVAVDATRPESPRVGWDRVVIPDRSPELMAAVALLLGQSAALERYERATNGLMDEALSLAGELSLLGRLPRNTRALVRRVGRITSDRLELARAFYLVDRPDDTWEDARVARIYDALFRNLELADRHQAMLHKLAATQTATETIIDLWQGRRSRTLEWAVVVLIVLEIALALVPALRR